MSSSQSFTIRRYDLIEELAPFWEDLLAITPDPRIFQTLGWHRAWLKAFASTGKSVFLLVFRDQRPLLFFPGFIANRSLFGFPQRELGLVGSYNYASDYLSLIGDHNDSGGLKVLAEEIFKTPGWGTLRINNLDPGHLFAKVLIDQSRSNSLSFDHYTLHHSPVLELSNKDKLLSIFSSRNSKRRIKHLFEKSQGVYREYPDKKASEQILPLLFEMHSSVWKQSQKTPQFEQADQRHFFQALTGEFEFGESLRLCGIELDGKPIALHLGLEFKDRYHWYKPAYSPGFAKLSAGEVLMLSEIKDCEARNISYFDFGAGSEEYKFRFSTDTPELEAIELYRTRINRAYFLLRRLKRLAVRYWRNRRGSE